jgi:hypothetical protein
MIAMLLAAQIAAAAVTPSTGIEAAPPPHGFITPVRPDEIVRTLQSKGCGASIGQMEVSLAQPAALYRKGDRPAKGLRDWIDYPNGQLCLVEARR